MKKPQRWALVFFIPLSHEEFNFTLQEARHFVKIHVSHKNKIWTVPEKSFEVTGACCCKDWVDHQISPKTTSVVVRSYPSLQKSSCTPQLKNPNFSYFLLRCKAEIHDRILRNELTFNEVKITTFCAAKC